MTHPRNGALVLQRMHANLPLTASRGYLGRILRVTTDRLQAAALLFRFSAAPVYKHLDWRLAWTQT